MDDPIVGPNTPIRLRRTCERNRLEKQLLIDAYETLVALIIPGEESHARSEIFTIEREPTEESAHSCEESEVCGVPA